MIPMSLDVSYARTDAVPGLSLYESRIVCPDGLGLGGFLCDAEDRVLAVTIMDVMALMVWIIPHPVHGPSSGLDHLRGHGSGGVLDE